MAHNCFLFANSFFFSYHYKAEIDGRPVLVPAELMGQIKGKHITLQDIYAHAQSAVEKMPDLQTYINKHGILVVDQGLAVLRAIEQVPLDANAIAYLEAAAQQNAALGISPHTANGRFAPLLAADQLGQTSYSGWELPTVPAGTTIAAPVGYGSAAGFLAIAAAYDAAKDKDAFQARYGFSGETAARATAFIRLVEAYVGYLQTFYPSNPFLDPASAAPWWQRPTALHVFWDNVIAPSHRVPYLLPQRQPDPGAAALPPGAVRGPANVVKNLRTSSVTATNYLEGHLLGKTVIATNADGAGALVIQANINVSRTEAAAGTTGGAFFDRKQGKPTDATTPKEIFDRLPAFARFAIGSSDKLAKNSRVSLLEAPPANAPAERKQLVGAYNLLVTLVYGTMSGEAGADANAAKRELARALAVNLLAAAPIGSVKTEADAVHAAGRILELYQAFVAPATGVSAEALPGLSAAELNAAMVRLGSDKPAFVRNFGDRYTEASRAGLLTPGITRDAQLALFESIDVQDQAGNELGFLASPLVYSPAQLASASAASRAKLTFSDPYAPGVPLTAAQQVKYAEAIRAAQTNPAAAGIGKIPASLRPIDSRFATGAGSSQAALLVGLMQKNELEMRNSVTVSRSSIPEEDEFALLVGRGGRRVAASTTGTGIPGKRRGDEEIVRAAADRKARRLDKRIGAAIDGNGMDTTVLDRFSHLYPTFGALLLTKNFVRNWAAVDSYTAAGVLHRWTAKGNASPIFFVFISFVLVL
jgi:hypothetical protein